MDQTIFTLFLGLVLGVKHALEADHVIAISTIVTEQKNTYKSAFLGAFWGMGHTTTLFLAGLLVLLLKISIPVKVSLSFEFIVGIMLVVLGIRVLLNARQEIHSHKHFHGKDVHSHPHVQNNNIHHSHKKSFLVGFVHGMAGSGALMILVLSTVKSVVEGIIYIVLFGIGSVIGMTVMSFIIGLPFIMAGTNYPKTDKFLKITAGTLSVVFGLYICYQIGVTDGLLGDLL